MSGKGQGQSNNDNKSDQCNPNIDNHLSYKLRYQGTGTKPDLDNHGNHLNSNHPEYKVLRYKLT